MKDYNYGEGLNKDTFGEELSRIKRNQSEYYQFSSDMEDTTIRTSDNYIDIEDDTIRTSDSCIDKEETTIESFSDDKYTGEVQNNTLSDYEQKTSSKKKFKSVKWIIILVLIIAPMANSMIPDMVENAKEIIQKFVPVESHSEIHEGTENGTLDKPNLYAKKVWIEGEELQLPCKMSELPDDFKLATNSQDVLDEIDDSGISYFVSLYYQGEYASVHLNLKNLSEKATTNIGDLDIVEVYESNQRQGQVKFYHGIKLGMKTETLENALENITYNVYKKPENTSYSFYLYDDSEVAYYVNTENGVVTSVSVTISEEYK